MDEEKQAGGQLPERASWALHSWCRDLVLCITVVTLLFAFLVDRFQNGTAKERDSV